jgi:hypothetical protein
MVILSDSGSIAYTENLRKPQDQFQEILKRASGELEILGFTEHKIANCREDGSFRFFSL